MNQERQRKLDAEIHRINKMIMSAAMRTLLVKRTKAIAACLEQEAAPSYEEIGILWCKRCDFAIVDHDALRAKLDKHDK